jgi:beta-glucosidase/6-phospho-beta-glucosidase/beta-galactosidase
MHSATEPAPPPSLFNSFWMGGFEASCHINRSGERVDMIAVTQHDLQAREDYKLLRSFGITSARDAVRWHLVDSGGRYNFSSFVPMLQAANEQGMQVVWDLCHYGWPDDVNVLSAAFVDRFARFSKAVARVIADSGDAVPFYTPVNELSFLPWAIGHRVIYPYITGRDTELKRQFVRASIAAVDAVRSVDPRARIVFGDPVVHVVPPRNRPELREGAAVYREAQFEAWDMICGRLHEDLGGSADYLDIVGVNYYFSNQWEHCGERLRWEDSPRDSRMITFSSLLAEVYNRYHKPLFVGETSHYCAGRAQWLGEIAAEVRLARCSGIPVEGLCLYPVIDRPDWDDFNHWHHCGLWDFQRGPDGFLERVLNLEYATELRRVQEIVPSRTGC